MRIWFDILTPKQVLFFKPVVNLLKGLGFELLCSSREYREAVDLAKIKKLELTIVGKHGGSNRYDKLKASTERIYELSDLVHAFDPNFSVSFSSPEAARISFGLGIKHIGFNDSPHAEAVARLTVPLMHSLFCPWVIPKLAWTSFGINKKNIIHYNALDPVAWIRSEYSLKENIREPGRNILVRLEESKASYIADKNLVNSSIRMLDDLVQNFSSDSKITVLCRYDDQIDFIDKRYGDKINLLSNVVDGASVISDCDIFIGAGGTMTAEASLIGKPTISIAPIQFYVEQYLIKSGLVTKTSNSQQLVKYVKKIFSDKSIYYKQKKLSNFILTSMDDPAKIFVSYLKNNA